MVLIVQAGLPSLKTGDMQSKKTVQAKRSHLHDCRTLLIPASLQCIKNINLFPDLRRNRVSVGRLIMVSKPGRKGMRNNSTEAEGARNCDGVGQI